MGVDGIVETATDDLFCYQAKFRTGRPALTWTELSTFFGLTDSGNGRLVFTNCDDITSVAEQRPGALFVRGSDLDRLTADDLRVIEAWISGASVARSRKSPLPHQAEAIDDILRGLARSTRATALMACGTGKTLVALWVAERLKVRSVLILLPSLALVRQTLHEWLHETSWPDLGYQYLCVCSDPTVQPEEDALVVRPSDVDFKVTAQSADVRRFLERPTDAVRLVFSTYQSCIKVAEGAVGLPMFDLGIFDEAHKTASRDGRNFALALRDERLPIARRLFLTATPRHYNVAAKDKFGDAKVVFSMDDPEVYGPVVHRLRFSTAAKLKVITDYKIAITIVTSKMVTDESLRRGIVLVEGQEIKARQVANQIALQSAIKRYDVRKIFTFHSKVAAAASFTSGGPEGIATHLPEFHCGHINGEMPTAQRERRMREFEAAPRAIMSNARCLTEGVDVPAVDMVAFLSPRRSLVDIVQATGRAMRRSPGKTVGYVLVPLYVEQARGETVEQAVVRTDFREVWKVLNQLQEHDDLLAQTIAEMRIERGKTSGFDDSRFREKVELLPPELSVESLRKAISAACLDAIGDNWFERYGQLVAYRERHGTCDMPHRLAENKPLATWVINQRVLRKEGSLTRERIALLDKIGFNWSPKAGGWRGNYLALLEYRERHGDCRVPQGRPEFKVLAQWVSRQRFLHAKGELSPDRFQSLDRIGFDWTIGLATWDERFQELCEYRRIHGDCRVPARWKENRQLATWVVSQRYDRRKGQLRDDYERRLAEIGFEWDPIPSPEFIWNRWLQRLRSFKDVNGHCDVPRTGGENSKLAVWITDQRRAARDGKLSEENRRKLDELGFIWFQKQDYGVQWNEMFNRLCAFQKAHGHVNVVPSSPDRKLARWVGTQRRYYRDGIMLPERLQKLQSIGFRWGRDRHEKPIESETRIRAPEKSWDDYFR
ncbi:MAG: Helicase associated domain protein [Chthoniobacteraceae bacterium]